jgi:hypothetical protein
MIDNVVITTETGSRYIIENNICKKTDSAGRVLDVFKVWSAKSVPDEVTTRSEIYDLPDSDPEIGKRMFIFGKDVSWISTKIVSVSKAQHPPEEFRDKSNGE